MENKIKHIYYRGYLDFCNYNCFYCPFSKNKANQTSLDKDKMSLEKFYSTILSEKPETVFILPYGEGLIHNHYLNFIAKLSKLDFIKQIGIQTNASFKTENLLDIFNENSGNLKKLNLWCSFHPSEVSISDFINKINQLKNYNINLTVGVVGNPGNIEIIRQLRELLPKSIYLWINSMDGMKRSYSNFEKDFFLSIDPYFNLELNKPSSNMDKCLGGKERIFVEASGKKLPCNISKSASLCKAKFCSCFLSYSNRVDLELLGRFEFGGIFRNLKNLDQDIIFFDIDGTLIDKDTLNSKTFEYLDRLKEKNILFLNTSLPYKTACQKLKGYISLFDGGIFSNGGDIKFFDFNYQLSFLIDKSNLTSLLTEKDTKYFLDSEIYPYKLMIFKSEFDRKFSNSEKIKLEKNYNISRDGRYIYFNNLLVNKEKAIEIVQRFYLLKDYQVTFFGNSENDIIANKTINNIIVSDEINSFLKEYCLK